jgi:Fe-Mn family superoxide dismutase
MKIQEFLLEAKRPEALATEPLPYGLDDLSPVLSKDSLNYHYSKLARGYATKYNDGQGDPDFNYAGSYLHNLFFPQLRAPRGSNKPQGQCLELINKNYGDFQKFQDKFAEEAMKIQGSGWIYLSRSGDIKVIANHAVRKDIAMLVDWWEHVWAIDYQHDKAKYLRNIWRIINWDIVNQRL